MMDMITTSTQWRFLPGYAHGFWQPCLTGAFLLEPDLAPTPLAQEQWQALLEKAWQCSLTLDGVRSVAETCLDLCFQMEQDCTLPVFQRGRVVPRSTELTDLKNVPFALASRVPNLTKTLLELITQALNIVCTKTFFQLDDPEAVCIKKLTALRQQMLARAVMNSNNKRIMQAAYDLQVPCHEIAGHILHLGIGVNAKRVMSTCSPVTAHLPVYIAQSKKFTAHLLNAAGLPGATHSEVKTLDDALIAAAQLGYPLVVKPSNLDRGDGVHAGIANETELRRAFAQTQLLTKDVLIEKHVTGHEYRVTVYRGEVVQVIERQAGGVTGDGVHTVTELLDLLLQTDFYQIRLKQKGKHNLSLDEEAMIMLKRQSMTANSIPSKGQQVALRSIANVSRGGTFFERTEPLPPENEAMFVRVAETVGLDWAGIDFITEDISRSWLEVNCVVCEVNSVPQLGFESDFAIFKAYIHTTISGRGKVPGLFILHPAGQQQEALALQQFALNTLLDKGYEGVLYQNESHTMLDHHAAFKKSNNIYELGQRAAFNTDTRVLLATGSYEDLLSTGSPLPEIDVCVFIETNTPTAQAALRLIEPHCDQLWTLDGPAISNSKMAVFDAEAFLLAIQAFKK